MARYKFVCSCKWTWFSASEDDNKCTECGKVVVGIKQ